MSQNVVFLWGHDAHQEPSHLPTWTLATHLDFPVWEDEGHPNLCQAQTAQIPFTKMGTTGKGNLCSGPVPCSFSLSTAPGWRREALPAAQPGYQLPAVAQGARRTTRGRFTEQCTAYTVSLTKHCTHSLTEKNTTHTGSLYKALHTQAR